MIFFPGDRRPSTERDVEGGIDQALNRKSVTIGLYPLAFECALIDLMKRDTRPTETEIANARAIGLRVVVARRCDT
jgi:hypothetical protein